MKRLALGILAAAATIDLVGDPDSAVVADEAVHGRGLLSALSLALSSPLATKIEYWGLSLIAAIVIAIALSMRKPAGPDILG